MSGNVRSNSPDDRIEFLLLDLHFNQCDPQQAAEIEAQVAASPELEAKCRAIRQVCSLLDACSVPEARADLADRVMARIHQHNRTIKFPQPAPAAPNGQTHQASHPLLSLRELVAIAAVITLFVGIFVPGYFKAQNIARRNLCASNLQQVWAGMSSYAQANGGHLPYYGYVAGGSWLPSRTPHVSRVSNTRPMYQLLRDGYVNNARTFICPTDRSSIPMRTDDYRQFKDFAEPANVSYSMQIMNVPRAPKLNDMNRRMVLIADRNPLFESRYAHRISPYNDRTVNSLIHEEGAGQNVMYTAGNGGWYTEPTIGVNGDNIYRAGALTRYLGTEQPTSPTDTFLGP